MGTSPRSLFEELVAQLEESWMALPDKPEETPESTVRALISLIGGDPTGESEVRLRDLVAQRKSGTPLAYLTGRQNFMGLDLLVSPEALIPRKETEILARGALEVLRAITDRRGTALVIDLCCGSGNVALALAHHEPRARVIGADLSQDCVNLATRNAVHVTLSDRVTFVQSDLLEAFAKPEFLGHVDLITCNPPYISSAKVEAMPHEISGYEPRLAFDGGPFGVKILTRLIREANRYLRKDGWLAFEVGLGQGPGVAKMLTKSGSYADIRELRDNGGETRSLIARSV